MLGQRKGVSSDHSPRVLMSQTSEAEFKKNYEMIGTDWTPVVLVPSLFLVHSENVFCVLTLVTFKKN